MQIRSLTKNAKDALRPGLALLFLVVFLAGTGCTTGRQEAMAGGGPKVTISPNPAEYKRKVEVKIAGSGFQPKQQLGLLIVMGGVPSDISGLVEPQPVTNEKGEFSTVWKIDREIRKKILSPTSHTIEVVDQDWKPLAKATLSFKKPAKKK